MVLTLQNSRKKLAYLAVIISSVMSNCRGHKRVIETTSWDEDYNWRLLPTVIENAARMNLNRVLFVSND